MDFNNENILHVEASVKQCVNDMFKGVYYINRDHIVALKTWDTEV